VFFVLPKGFYHPIPAYNLIFSQSHTRISIAKRSVGHEKACDANSGNTFLQMQMLKALVIVPSQINGFSINSHQLQTTALISLGLFTVVYSDATRDEVTYEYCLLYATR